MINPLSSQNYQYEYAAASVTQPTNNPVTFQPKVEVSPAPVNVGASKNLQELIPRQCQT